MHRGEVWWVSFLASSGGEVQKTRPAIIVSNDTCNTYANRVQVIPCTRNVSRIFPSEALISVKGVQCKAMADQIATVSKERVLHKLDVLSDGDLSAVELAVRVQLGFFSE